MPLLLYLSHCVVFCLQGLIARLQAGHVAAAFNTWKERAASHQARQARLRAAVMKLTQSRLAAAWSSWHCQAQFAARAKSVVRAAITRLQQQVMTMHATGALLSG